MEKLEARSNGTVGVDPQHTLHHCIGNFMNNIVFGKVYEEDDEVWKWLRDVQEEGIKLIGVSSKSNFIPFLRWVPLFCFLGKYFDVP